MMMIGEEDWQEAEEMEEEKKEEDGKRGSGGERNREQLNIVKRGRNFMEGSIEGWEERGGR